MTRRITLGIVTVLLCLWTMPLMAADPTAEELGDVAAPEGVDSGDVERMFRLIADPDSETEDDTLRGNVAPGTLLSDPQIPPTPATPHVVAPNPLPLPGGIDIGDAVLVSRRAAGEIVFDGLNAAPTVTLYGDGSATSQSSWSLSGMVVDDQDMTQVSLEILLNGEPLDIGPQPGEVTNDGSFSLSIPLVEGYNTVQARAADIHGRIGPYSDIITLLLDTVPPVVTMDNPLDGAYTNQSPLQANGSATDDAGIAEVLVNGSPANLIDMGDGTWLWGGDVSFATEGPQTVSVVAQDTLGNASDPVSVTVTYDITMPLVAFDPSTPTLVNVTELTLTGTFGDNYAFDTLTVNGDMPVMDTMAGTFSITVPLTEGDNSFTLEARDMAGNVNTPEALVIVADHTPPVLELLSDTFVSASPYTWHIGISEPVTVASLNGVADGTQHNGAAFTIPGQHLQEGENNMVIVARDDAGNEVTVTFTVVLDTTPPDIVITAVYRDGYLFAPEGGVNGVATNAPTVFIRGTVSDASGVDSVTVNGYDAPVTDGVFDLGPLPLIPRENPVTAIAVDVAGNSAQDAITVIQDVEGPVIAMTDFQRGAHIDIDGVTVNPDAGVYDGRNDITVTGTVADQYVTVTGMWARWGETDLMVAFNDAAGTFSFVIPYTDHPNLYLLEVGASDELTNDNTNFQSALTGRYALRATEVHNGVGLGLAPEGLSAFSDMIEEQVEAMDGSVMINETVSQSGITIDVTGIAFCDPGSGHRFDDPSGVMNPPTCRYGCDQEVDVTMGIDGDGHIDIVMTIPYLHVDMYMRPNFLCWGGTEMYAKSQPAVISLKADFVDTPTGPALQAVPGSINVAINGFDIQTEGCGLAGGILGLAEGTIRDAMAEAFESQMDTILGSLGSALGAPLMENVNTEFSLYIAHASNDIYGIKFWLDFQGNPCPDPTRLTDKPDDSTPDPDDFKMCPDPTVFAGAQDIYDCPGSFLTANDTPADLPELTLVDADGMSRLIQAAINDDFVNYMLFTEWAQGTLDMVIDQALVGEALSLDTGSFSIFVPELANQARTDVQAIVPTGTPIVITMHPMVPITAEGINNPAGEADGLRVRGGDIILSFWADTAGNGSFSTPLFDIALTLYADATMTYHMATESWGSDYLAIELGDPEMYIDLAWSAFVISEGTLRANMPNLLDLVLPMFVDSLGHMDLPGSGMRLFEVGVIDPNAEFINIFGDVVASIAITQPLPDAPISGDLPFTGEVAGLWEAAGALDYNFAVYLGPNDPAATPTQLANPAITLVSVDEGRLSWTGSIEEALLVDGENRLMVAVTDNNFPDDNGVAHTAYAVMVIDYDAATGESTVISGQSDSASGSLLDSLSNLEGCLGCQGDDGAVGMLLLFAIFGILFIRRRRRLTGMTLLIAAFAIIPLMSACDSTSATSPPVDGDNDSSETDGDDDGDISEVESEEELPPNKFTGADVEDNPVVVLNMVAVGDETQGFNLDEGRSPQGDPDPDNGLASLADIANDPLADALEKGDILLLLQFNRLEQLPAPGESGSVDIAGYLGQDMDDDATNNFDGNQTFAIDPSSYDADGNLLITFNNVGISADDDGTVRISGGPAVFTLSVPIDDKGTVISLTITETLLEGALAVSSLRSDGIDLNDGMLGGIMPCSILGEPLEALGDIAPLALLKDEVDIDLNEDGRLDKRNEPDNEDGVTAAVLLSGVPARIDHSTANRAPVIALDDISETTDDPLLPVSGTFDDPDGECINATVTVRVDDGEEIAMTTETATEGCTFSGEVTLHLDENVVIATVTDEKGAAASDSGEILLTDDEAPVISITGPMGPDVTEAIQILTGVARDNVAIAGVQIAVANGATYAILGEDLDETGGFAIEIELPILGENTITAKAKDTANIESEEVTHTLNLVDETGPVFTLTEVSDGVTTVSPPEDLIVHRADVTVKGTVFDDFTETVSNVRVSLNDGEAIPCTYDALVGSFSVDLTLALGENSLSFSATDDSENTGSLDVTVSYLDDEAPVIAVTAPEPLVYAASQTLRFTVTDNIDEASLLAPIVTVDGAAVPVEGFDSEAGEFYLPVFLVFGDNAVTIEVADLSNNTGTWSGVIQLDDQQAPTLTVTAPEDGIEVLTTEIDVVGVALDDIGLGEPPVSITVGETLYTPEVDENGAFTQTVTLVDGENVISVVATDMAGLSAEEVRRVTYRDPDAPDIITLTADPATILIVEGESTLTAMVERYAGGPVPEGTMVTFSLSTEDHGSLDATEVSCDVDGMATATFSATELAGSVDITATAGSISDSATVTVSEPTIARLSLCASNGASFAGVHTSLTYGGAATLALAPEGSLTGSGPAEAFNVFNTADAAPALMWAGIRLLEPAEETEIGIFEWPIDQGVPAVEDFSLGSARVSDLLGHTASSDAFAVCGLENLLGDLAPVVNLQPLPASVNQPDQVVEGAIEDANLATCTGVLTINGVDQSVDVSSGSISMAVVL